MRWLVSARRGRRRARGEGPERRRQLRGGGRLGISNEDKIEFPRKTGGQDGREESRGKIKRSRRQINSRKHIEL